MKPWHMLVILAAAVGVFILYKKRDALAADIGFATTPGGAAAALAVPQGNGSTSGAGNSAIGSLGYLAAGGAAGAAGGPIGVAAGVGLAALSKPGAAVTVLKNPFISPVTGVPYVAAKTVAKPVEALVKKLKFW